MELDITPSTSYISRVEQDQQARGNLLEEFEKIASDAQLHPLATPSVVNLMGGEQEEQLSRAGLEVEWCHGDTFNTDCAARGKETSSSRRQSGLGCGAVGATTPTSSLF